LHESNKGFLLNISTVYSIETHNHSKTIWS